MESESNWDSLLGTIKRLLVGSLLLVGVAVFWSTIVHVFGFRQSPVGFVLCAQPGRAMLAKGSFKKNRRKSPAWRRACKWRVAHTLLPNHREWMARETCYYPRGHAHKWNDNACALCAQGLGFCYYCVVRRCYSGGDNSPRLKAQGVPSECKDCCGQSQGGTPRLQSRSLCARKMPKRLKLPCLEKILEKCQHDDNARFYAEGSVGKSAANGCFVKHKIQPSAEDG